ncbi:MAG: cytochrome C [Deltaproteobacteria bacterium]|nr:cytochrome C [Candidatus Anaeroferrophillus wilburensis]MBN2887828.1 cytochrome C [Deltaproteobacteria bacterium]
MGKKWISIVFAMLLVAILATPSLAASSDLLATDCIKCHTKAVEDIATSGGLHQTAVSCLDCHVEHPPKGENAIPQCAQCHAPGEKAHYQVANCITCHYPHRPLKMDLDDAGAEVKPVCLTCHDNEGQEMASYPSKHAELNCTECHPQHAMFQDCLQCHEPHSSEMAYQDCLRCHKPHMPTVVKYDQEIPSPFCGSCHENELATLASNQTKHHELLCVYCHKSQHKTVPECVTCHGEPHGAGMHKKFPDCLTCHIDAHALTSK